MALDPHGLPVLNGIWQGDMTLRRYAVESDAKGDRTLTETGSFGRFAPPREAGKYETKIHAEAQLPAVGGRVICGTVRTDTADLGFVMAFAPGRSVFVASFDFARPFIGLEVHGCHILAENASGEIWRFDISDPAHITAEITA
jgi:hypothetical protein